MNDLSLTAGCRVHWDERSTLMAAHLTPGMCPYDESGRILRGFHHFLVFPCRSSARRST